MAIVLNLPDALPSRICGLEDQATDFALPAEPRFSESNIRKNTAFACVCITLCLFGGPATAGPEDDLGVMFRGDPSLPPPGGIAGTVTNKSAQHYDCVDLVFRLFYNGGASDGPAEQRVRVQDLSPRSVTGYSAPLQSRAGFGLQRIETCASASGGNPPAPSTPRIVSFRVSPANVKPGASIKFYWEVENADRVQLFDDAGEVDFRADMKLRVDGWFSTTISKTTAFRLLAKGRDGRTAQDTFVVRVAKPGQPTCRTRSMKIANQRVYPLGQGSFEAAFKDHGASRNFGDTEMGGNNPRITIEATVREQRVGRQYWLVLDGGVEMVERRGDRSSFYKPFTRHVARIPAGCTLRKPATGRLIANSGKNNHGWTWYRGKGVIKGANCRSDTKGNDKGKLGCVIQFQRTVLSDR